MEHSNEFLPLLVVLFLAFVVPLLLTRFRSVPVVVGEIAAGMLVAAFGIFPETHGGLLTIFSDIGLAFLMFLAGMEIDFDRLFGNGSGSRRKTGVSVPLLALAVYLLTLALAEGGAFFLNWIGLEGNPHLLAFLLSATSLGVLLPILKGRGMIQTPGGQLIFLSGLLADFLTVILLTIFIIFQQNGLNLEILSLFLIFLVFLVVARIGQRFVRLRAVRRVVDELSQATVQFKVRGAFTILLGFVVLAETLGAELILGAFLAGMIISLIKSPEDEDLVHKLEAFGFGFFIPVFFIVTGAGLDLNSLFQSPETLLFIPILFGLSILVKSIPALLLRRIMPWRETLAAGLLLNTHLSLEVAVGVIGLRLGLFSSATATAVILFAILTVLLMPILFNAIIPAAEGVGRRSRLVFGWDNLLARRIAQELQAHGDQVSVLVEGQADAYRQVKEMGLEPAPVESLPLCQDDFVPVNIQTFLAFSQDDEANYQAVRHAQAAGVSSVIALINNPADQKRFAELGVQTLNPERDQVPLLTFLARNPDLIRLLTSTDDERDIREYELNESDMIGKRINKLKLPAGLLILTIIRKDELIVPHGTTRLASGDRLTIFGSLEAHDEVSAWLT
ncbi:MAG: cation:proton antiporter [Anaerolineales bacterium]|nr:cation:proton antiporter [Anaerolineales bacterium]